MGDVAHGMLSAFSGYLKTSQFSDLTIITKDKELKVHKVVVCAHSEYFARMLSGEWKESTEGVVHLEEDDPDAIEAMIRFMYGMEYAPQNELDRPGLSVMLLHIKVYELTSKYMVTHLAQAAKENLRQSIISTTEGIDDDSGLLMDLCVAYNTAHRQSKELSDIVTGAAQDYIYDFLDKDGFLGALRQAVYFDADVVRWMMDARFRTYECPYCGTTWTANLEYDGSDGYLLQPKELCIRCGKVVNR